MDPKIVDLMNGFHPTWQNIFGSLDVDLFPTEVKERAPEEIVEALLAEQKTASSDCKVIEKSAAVESLKAHTHTHTQPWPKT